MPRERQTDRQTETDRQRQDFRSKNTEALNVQQYNAYNTKCNPK